MAPNPCCACLWEPRNPSGYTGPSYPVEPGLHPNPTSASPMMPSNLCMERAWELRLPRV